MPGAWRMLCMFARNFSTSSAIWLTLAFSSSDLALEAFVLVAKSDTFIDSSPRSSSPTPTSISVVAVRETRSDTLARSSPCCHSAAGPRLLPGQKTMSSSPALPIREVLRGTPPLLRRHSTALRHRPLRWQAYRSLVFSSATPDDAPAG